MTRTVFFGASTVEGHGASSPEHRFSTVAAHALGWEEINLGLSGTCVTGRDAEGQVLDEDSGLGRVPDVLETQPDLVVILYGANDVIQDRPLGDPGQFRQGTFWWDYDTMVRGLLFQLQPAQLILMTLPPRADAEQPNAVGKTFPDYNQAIQDIGARHGVRVLDTYNGSGLDTVKDYAEDRIHPNDTGHQCLAAFLIQAMHEKPTIA